MAGARELLDEAETKVFRIAESTARSQQDFLNMEQILTEVVERVQNEEWKAVLTNLIDAKLATL